MSLAGSGLVLEPLTRDNYENWSALVRNYLIGEDLWEVVTFVSEVSVKPKALSKTWQRQNAKALYIIQLASGSEVLTQIRDLETAKEAWNRLDALYSSQLKADPDDELGMDDGSLLHNKPLHRYVESGEWNHARSIIDGNYEAIFSTSSMGRTVLHVAVIAGHEDIVEKLVNLGTDKLLKMQDNFDYTALALAAHLTGNVNIARCMVENYGGRDLLTIKTKDNEIPVLLSAVKGHKEMTRYLYQQTHLDVFLHNNSHYGVLLLTQCITAKIFDVALSLIHRVPQLPLTVESNSLRPLYALACMPSAFPSGCEFGLRQQLIYNFLRLEKAEIKLQNWFRISIRIVPDVPLEIVYKQPPVPDYVISPLFYIYGLVNFQLWRFYKELTQTEDLNVAQQEGKDNTSFAGWFYALALNFPPIKLLVLLLKSVYLLFQHWILLKFFTGNREIYEHKRTHCLVLEILKCLCKRISDYKESQLREASAYDAMLQAAKLGIIEFIDAMRKANPDLLWAIDKNKRDIFSHAILNRKKDVFHLINGLNNGRKEIIKCRKDVFGNTLLHLAAYLGPSFDHKSGAALQIQRELQWFKTVEKIVHPKCKEEKNANGKKPHEVFSESHVEMVKTGEKWAKDTAISFTLVGTFIIIIMFAATFTISGGNNQETGVPIFLSDHILTLFIIADVISIFSSSTSVLVFLGILASRYAEKDFLKTLPLKLLFGLVTLFLSMVAMMVAICALLVMMLKEYQLVVIAAMSLGSIPVIVLVPSLLGLFDIFKSICMQHI